MTAPEPMENTDPKQEEWKKNLLQAWIQTRMEFDRSVLTLSAGGIGLLITLLTTADQLAPSQFLLASLSVVGFLIALALVLFVFRKNADYLLALAKEDEYPRHHLATADKAIPRVFGISVFLSALAFLLPLADETLGRQPALESVEKITTISSKMTDSRNLPKPPPEKPIGKRSLDGIEAFKPKPSSDNAGDTNSGESPPPKEEKK